MFSPDYFRSIYSKAKEKTIIAAFGGVLNNEFIQAFIKHNDLKAGLSFNEVESVYNRLKNAVFTVTGTRPFKEAQVSLGGVSADEVDPVSFESKLHKNLFIMGEAIDYTGGCGGYNIHWCAATARGVADKLKTGSDRE
jgi:predicted flavoprotein YhiN